MDGPCFFFPVGPYSWLRWLSSGVATTQLQLRKPLKQPQKQDTAFDVTVQQRMIKCQHLELTNDL